MPRGKNPLLHSIPRGVAIGDWKSTEKVIAKGTKGGSEAVDNVSQEIVKDKRSAHISYVQIAGGEFFVKV